MHKYSNQSVNVLSMPLGALTRLDLRIKRIRSAEGPFLAVVKVSREKVRVAVPLWDGVELKARFRNALTA